MYLVRVNAYDTAPAREGSTTYVVAVHPDQIQRLTAARQGPSGTWIYLANGPRLHVAQPYGEVEMAWETALARRAGAHTAIASHSA